MFGLLIAAAGAQVAPAPAPAPPATPKPAAPGDKTVPAQPTPLPGEPLCGFCKTTGRVASTATRSSRSRTRAAPTWKVDFCSTAYESDNMGLSWMPCPHCKTPSLQAAAQKEWNEHKAAGADWIKERRRTDKVVGADKPLTFVQTTHFLVVWDIPKITTAQKKTYDAHAAAHLYAHRLEDFYARFQSMFGIKDSENMKNLHTLMVFEKHDEAWLAGPAYTMLQGVPTVKRAGGSNHDSCVVTWWDKSLYPKEADMWRHQIHNFTHQLTAIYYDMTWFEPGKLGLSPPWLEDKYGWLDEGLAHWFEIDFDKQARTYCMRETDTESRWGGDDWHKNIFKPSPPRTSFKAVSPRTSRPSATSRSSPARRSTPRRTSSPGRGSTS